MKYIFFLENENLLSNFNGVDLLRSNHPIKKVLVQGNVA